MNETSDATAFFAPLWKRKWLILAVAVVAGLGSYLYYKHQHAVYSATTQVYLGNGAEEQAQLNTGASTGGKKANAPNSTTQAALINSSIIKSSVHAQLRQARKTSPVRAALKGKSEAKAAEKSEFITIDGEAHNARGAALLVNTTAQTYVKRQNVRYRREVENAIALARKQLRRVEAGQLESLIASASPSSGKTSGSSKTSGSATIQAATLSAKINQLESDLGISQVAQVDPAKPKQAQLVSPHPRSNAIFGFAIGLLLAACGAYAIDRFDRRLRSVSAIEEVFQAPVLTALQAVRRPIVIREGHPTPANALREALWRLQATLRVGGASQNGEGGGARTILCISADAGDGKSTLVAALALVLGEAGERVAVVEADFRRPVQGRVLSLPGPQGLADVITGMLPLEDATQSVSLLRPEAGVGAGSPPLAGAGGAATVVETAGSVSVLVGGTGVANPPALLGRASTTELIGSLREDFDHVLIDAPSPLQVSDAVPLLGEVDGVLIVARAGHTRVTTAQRLVQFLHRTPCAPVLGVVANAVPSRDIKRQGINADPVQGRRGLRHNLIGR